MGSEDRRLSSGVTSADLVVVGAGILGLAVAREALLRYDGLSVLVLEKEDRIAAHQTGHNSGVVHSGIYYAPGSLKARLCVAGKPGAVRLLRGARDRDGALRQGRRRVGRARPGPARRHPRPSPRERRSRSDASERGGSPRGRAGGAGNPCPPLARDGHRRLPAGREALSRRRSSGSGRRSGCGRPCTASRRSGDRAVRLATTAGPVEARVVITCAGLHSDRLARMTGGPASPRIVPFRGRYHALLPEASGLVRGLVYPVPDPSFPFLGVHFTKQISGEVWTGPNAVLALAREGYRGLGRQRARSVGDAVVLGVPHTHAALLAGGPQRDARRPLEAHVRPGPPATRAFDAGGVPGRNARGCPRSGALERRTAPRRLLVRPRGQGSPPAERPLARGHVEPGAREGGRAAPREEFLADA